MKFKFIILSALICLWAMTSSCNKDAGCPAVKSYTESSQPKSSKKGGAEPWTKKYNKKNKKSSKNKSTSGLFGKSK